MIESKSVTAEQIGDYQFYLDEFLLHTSHLSNFQAFSLLRLLEYEWHSSTPPSTFKECKQIIRPVNGRQSRELAKLFEGYNAEPFIRDARFRRSIAVRKFQDQDWPFIRQRILERDNHICAYCGARANSVDHILPRVQGGTHDLENLVACCSRCNSRKSRRTPEQAGMPILFLGGQGE